MATNNNRNVDSSRQSSTEVGNRDVANRPGVNAAFLQQVKDDEHVVPELLSAVSNGLNVPQLSSSQSTVMLAVFRRLHAQLKYRFQLEEVLGYVDEVATVAPRLSDKATALQHEHPGLLRELQAVVEFAHDSLFNTGEPTPMPVLDTLRGRFDAFRTQLDAHESAENDLIIESLYLDIGVGD